MEKTIIWESKSKRDAIIKAYRTESSRIPVLGKDEFGEFGLYIEYNDRFMVEYPVSYKSDNGTIRIAYDYPERINKTTMAKFESLVRKNYYNKAN